MPRLSFSKASVCLSVTYLSSLLSLLDLGFCSNNSYTHYTPLVVEYSLDGVPRLVPDPAHDPAIVVHVLFLHGQTADVANHIFVHDLAASVTGDPAAAPGLRPRPRPGHPRPRTLPPRADCRRCQPHLRPRSRRFRQG